MKQLRAAVIAGTFMLNFVAFVAVAAEATAQAPNDGSAPAATTAAAPVEDPAIKICQCQKDNCGSLGADRSGGDQRSSGGPVGNHSLR